MAKINLVGQGVKGRSPSVTAQERHNLYAEVIPGIGDKSNLVLYGMPGHKPLQKPTTAAVCLLAFDSTPGDERLYYATAWQSSPHLYFYDSNIATTATPTDVGSVSSGPFAPFGYSAAFDQYSRTLLLCAINGTAGGGYTSGMYACDASATLTSVGPSGADVTCLEFCGGVWVCNDTQAPGAFYYTLDPMTWGITDVRVDNDVGEIVRFLWVKDTLVIFGTKATTFYSLSSNPDEGFDRIPGVIAGFALTSAVSLARCGDFVFFQAERSGSRFFAMLDGYNVNPIDAPDLSWRENAYFSGYSSPVYGAVAFQNDGHVFYVPFLDVDGYASNGAHCYDATSGLWGSITGKMFSALAYPSWDRFQSEPGTIAGLQDGNIVQLRSDYGTYRVGSTDVDITRRLVIPHIYDSGNNNNTILRQVRLDVDPAGPVPTLYRSRDGGATWGTGLTPVVTADGKTLQWNPMGMAREWTLKFEATGDETPLAWISGYADIAGAAK